MSQTIGAINKDDNKDDMIKILLDFFQQATKALNECTIDHPISTSSLNEIRTLLLQVQMECLQNIVNDYNNNNNNNTIEKITVEQIQNILRDIPSTWTDDNPELIKAMTIMDDTARLAFTRLILQSEYYWNERKETDSGRYLNTSNPMKREDILEFCILCQLAVQLPNVQQHLIKGTPLYNTIKEEEEEEEETKPKTTSSHTNVFPDQRLHAIQRMILQALGYDPKHGSNEIRRLFFQNGTTRNEFSDDTEIIQSFTNLTNSMNTLLKNITIQSTNELFLSDHDDGGCTRVVAVTYSEKIIDNNNNDNPSSQLNDNNITDNTLPPTLQVIDNSTVDTDEKRTTLQMAGEANRLQQVILGELLLMDDDERQIILQNAKQVSDEFVQHIMTLSSREERIDYLQSIDETTKKLMTMYKLWENMVASNNGQPPIIRYNNNNNDPYD